MSEEQTKTDDSINTDKSTEASATIPSKESVEPQAENINVIEDGEIVLNIDDMDSDNEEGEDKLEDIKEGDLDKYGI